jgi:hypothetical protein
MSGFYTNLPRILRSAGIDVVVMDGAETRTSRATGFDVDGVVWHHTATSTAWQDGHVALLLRDGRRDLSGPLSQVGVERDGTWVIVALGRANHNGYGTYVPGWDFGNDSLGLEFYNDGTEPFTDAQMQSGIAGTRAVLLDKGLPAGNVCGHKESDPNRKIDPNFDMAVVRRALALPTQPPSDPEDDEAVPVIVKSPTSPAWWVISAFERRHVKDRAHAGTLVISGLARWDNGAPFTWSQAEIDKVPLSS